MTRDLISERKITIWKAFPLRGSNLIPSFFVAKVDHPSNWFVPFTHKRRISPCVLLNSISYSNWPHNLLLVTHIFDSTVTLLNFFFKWIQPGYRRHMLKVSCCCCYRTSTFSPFSIITLSNVGSAYNVSHLYICLV